MYLYEEAYGALTIKRNCGIDVKFLPPNEPGLLALFHKGVEEAAEDVEAVTHADLSQTGMIGQRLCKVIAEIPMDAEAVSYLAHQLAPGANPFKKHHQLELEEDDGIDRWSSTTRIGLLYELTHK